MVYKPTTRIKKPSTRVKNLLQEFKSILQGFTNQLQWFANLIQEFLPNLAQCKFKAQSRAEFPSYMDAGSSGTKWTSFNNNIFNCIPNKWTELSASMEESVRLG